MGWASSRRWPDGRATPLSATPDTCSAVDDAALAASRRLCLRFHRLFAPALDRAAVDAALAERLTLNCTPAEQAVARMG
jgi:hypothetical protein